MHSNANTRSHPEVTAQRAAFWDLGFCRLEFIWDLGFWDLGFCASMHVHFRLWRRRAVTITQSNTFHDRFLLVDDTVYHIGASLKDLGRKLFAFSKMEIKAADILKNI